MHVQECLETVNTGWRKLVGTMQIHKSHEAMVTAGPMVINEFRLDQNNQQMAEHLQDIHKQIRKIEEGWTKPKSARRLDRLDERENF